MPAIEWLADTGDHLGGHSAHRPQSSSASRLTAGAFGFLTSTQCGKRPFFGLATPDWCDKLVQSEPVGGRAHETQCIWFVWSGSSAAYRNGGVDAFSRDAFRRRCWQLEVLQQRWN